jgi:hypothetical protein
MGLKDPRQVNPSYSPLGAKYRWLRSNLQNVSTGEGVWRDSGYFRLLTNVLSDHIVSAFECWLAPHLRRFRILRPTKADRLPRSAHPSAKVILMVERIQSSAP